MVNLYVNLVGLREAQIAGKTLFLCVYVRVFPTKFSTWICSLSQDHTHQCRWDLNNLLRSQIEQKGRGKNLFFTWVETSIHPVLPSVICALILVLDSDWDLHHWLFWFSGLWVWTGTISSALLVLQLADGRLWDFSLLQLCESIHIKKMSSYIHMILVCFFGESWIIHKSRAS